MADPITDTGPYTSLSTYFTLEDIQNQRSASSGYASSSSSTTPVLLLKQQAQKKKYDTVCLPLTTDRWRKRWTQMCIIEPDASEEDKQNAAKEAERWRLTPGFRMDELTITRLDEAENISVMVSQWLELDAAEDGVRHDAEIALQQELAYASYLNISTAILPAPRNRNHVASYARIVNSCLQKLPMLSLSVRLPIYNPTGLQPSSAFSPSASSNTVFNQRGGVPITPASKVKSGPSTPSLFVSGEGKERDGSGGDGLNATWEMWDVIRSMCDYNRRLTLTLDLTPALPTTLGVLSKWAAEAVANIFLPSSTFIANTKGYPVLPKPTQHFIRENMIHRPTIILAGVSSGAHAKGGEAAYSQYVLHLERTSPVVQAAQKPGTVENFAQGYQDYLQAPLQPLMDNLPSVTYQTFEQDPVKYMLYEEAMYKAFLDKPSGERFVVCVAGAGRGPLVARCLKALERSRRDAQVYVVEKNPNAFVTLQERKSGEWKDKVELIFGDMRVVRVPEQADILVSELLGSFGDNELSPECLDGAMRFLKPNGISIPSSYTAHLAPLSSSKLYNEARISSDAKHLETPYVVMFQAVNILSGTKAKADGRCGPKIQECWEFEHPRRDNVVLDERGLPFTNAHNTRSATLRFYIPHAGILHGLAGYFEAVLYGNVGLSIHPHRKDQVSKDMLSWFPLFFPFKEPLYLPSNSELQVSIWRLTNDRQVWYEWHAESFISIPTKGDSNSESESLLLRTPLSSSFSSSSSSLFSAPSPLIDGKDPSFMSMHGDDSVFLDDEEEIVKIGHTSLHNPGGRSSFIGL